jgi:DNA invertase Pin-like site-specific DNA recombinase
MKAALYCRLSEEDRNKLAKTDDSESIQNQKTMLIQYAFERGWEIFQIYSDDDCAGADRSRPGYNRLLADAEAKRFDIVLCKSQSRFTREMAHVEKYIHDLFPLWGIRFVGVVDNADTLVKGNKKARQINGLINEWYLEDISENIKSVFNVKKANGVHIGSFALYGYKKNPNQKGHLIIDREAADIVHEVFTLFAKGCGKNAIARTLNERGVPNPAEYKRRNGLRYCQARGINSTLWSYYTISDMLVNEMYIGHMIQGRYRSVSYKTKINKPCPKNEWVKVPNTHEPIIEQELWDRVQSMIAQKFKPFADTGKIGLFARKAKCMHCKYTMRSHISRGKRYLQCSAKIRSGDACIGSFVSVQQVEDVILTELRGLINQYLNKDELVLRLERDTKRHTITHKSKKALPAYVKRYEDCSKALKDLYMDKSRGIITEEDFIHLSNDFNEERNKLKNLIKQTQDVQTAHESRIEETNDMSAYLDIKKLTRVHVDSLIDCIYVGRRDAETREMPLEIHWNF